MYFSTNSYTKKLCVLYIMSHVTDPNMFRYISHHPQESHIRTLGKQRKQATWLASAVEQYIFGSYVRGMESYKNNSLFLTSDFPSYISASVAASHYAVGSFCSTAVVDALSHTTRGRFVHSYCSNCIVVTTKLVGAAIKL
jgi:hypothetical protein